jgi:hypothetical protein
MRPAPPRPVAIAARLALAAAAWLAMLAPPPALARDSLGMFEGWGAFRDQNVPRCYAIAIAIPSKLHRDYQPYATIGTWPKRAMRNQLHLRLSRKMARGARITLAIGGQRFALVGGGGDAWPRDKGMNAAIVAAMRSASTMKVYATDNTGKRFSNTWPLAGAASAMDAATLGCARLR